MVRTLDLGEKLDAAVASKAAREHKSVDALIYSILSEALDEEAPQEERRNGVLLLPKSYSGATVTSAMVSQIEDDLDEEELQRATTRR